MPEPVTSSPVERELNPRRHLLLGLIFVGALALRLVYLWGQARNNPLFADPFMDGRVHHDWARQIASGAGMDPLPYFRAPLYYYLLGLLYKLAGPSVGLGRLAGCALGAATCYLIARLGVRVAGYRAGLLAGIIAALYWPFIYFDAELLSAGLEVFLDVAFLLLLLVAARRASLWLFLLSGVVWGLSAITRPNVLALAPGVALWLWFAVSARPRWKRWIATTAITCAGAALAILPVTLRNYFVGGELVLIASHGGVNFYIGNNPSSNGFVAVVPGTRPGWWEGYQDTHRIVEHALGRKPTEREVSHFWFDEAVEWIRSEPGAWARLMLLKLRLFWTPMEIPNNQPIWFFVRMSGVAALFWIGFPVVACLGVAGFVLHRSMWRSWALLLIFGVIYTGTVVAFFCPARYRLPVTPVLIVSAAAGLTALPRYYRTRRFKPLGAYAGIAGLLAAAMPFNLPKEYDAFDAHNEAEGHRLIGAHYARVEPKSLDNLNQAAAHFAQALEYQPEDTGTPVYLANVLLQLPDGTDRAVQVLRQAVNRQPANRPALVELATVLTQTRRYEEAVSHFRRALRLGPASPRLHYYYARALRLTGHHAEAIEALREGLAAAPRDTRLMTALAWLRATAPVEVLRDGAAAVQLAERALTEQTSPMAFDAAAAAYAEVGRFDDAVRHARRALEMARQAGRDAQAAQIEARLHLYQQHRPYREPTLRSGPSTSAP